MENLMQIIKNLLGVIGTKKEEKLTEDKKWEKHEFPLHNNKGEVVGDADLTGLLTGVVEKAIFMAEMDPFMNTQSKRKEIFHNACSRMEKDMNIHILPVTAKSAVTVGKEKGMALLAINNITGDWKVDFSNKFESVYGVKPADSVFAEFAKHLKYMNSPINLAAGSPTMEMMILNKDNLVNPDVFDGALFYNADGRNIFNLSYGKEYHLNLDGTTFQVRGVSNTGHIVKGTLQPITINELLQNFKSNKDEVLAAFNSGVLIGTGDTLKKATPGNYSVKFYYHNDSKTAGNMLRDGILLFEQWYRHAIITAGPKLKDIMTKKANVFISSLTNGNDLVNFLNKYRESINDGTLPTKDFWSVYDQVLIGKRPLGSHASDKNAVLKSFDKAIGAHFQVSAGMERYFDRKGNMAFSFKEHHAIYGNNYIHIDNSLEDGTISVPRGFFDGVARIIKNTEHGELNIAVRRDPITWTSVRKVTHMIRREDNYDTVGLPASMMKDLGGDSDGDKCSIIIWEKELFDFVDVSTKYIHDIKLSEEDNKVFGNVSKFYNVYRPNDSNNNIDRLFEVMEAEKVGIVDSHLSKVMWNMHLKGRNHHLIMKATHHLENTMLSSMIDGMKHTMEHLPNLDKLGELTKVLEVDPTIKLIRGKMKTSRSIDSISDIPKFIKEVVEESDIYNDQHPMYVVHKIIINSIKNESLTIDIAGNTIKGLWNRDVSYNARANFTNMLRTIKKEFAPNMSTIYGSWGFFEQNFGKSVVLVKNVRLEQFFIQMNALRNTDTDAQKKINGLKEPLMNELMSLPATDNGKIIMQILLVMAAWSQTPSGLQFSFVYNYVDVRVLRVVMDILMGKNPQDFLSTLKNNNQEEQ